MRSHLSIVLVVSALVGPWAHPATALAAPRGPVFAQTDTSEQSDETGGEEGGGAGQDDPGAETGAGEGETEGAEEPGPVWTYQMARIVVVLLVFLLAAIGLMYWRLVASRRKGTA